MTQTDLHPSAAADPGQIAVLIERMNKWYGSFHVLRDIDLSVR